MLKSSKIRSKIKILTENNIRASFPDNFPEKIKKGGQLPLPS